MPRLLPKSSSNIKRSSAQYVNTNLTKHRSPAGYWEKQENIHNFLSQIKEQYNLSTPEDWNSITNKTIESNGGGRLLRKYSMFDLKCMACPEGKSIFNNPPKPAGYWEIKENVLQFLLQLKEKFNIEHMEDWNSITKENILNSGGRTLFSKYSMFEIKCMAFPEGKIYFENPSGYWENEQNILHFLSKIKAKYNLNSSKDWSSITKNHIQSNGGSLLLKKHSMFELKCMAFPVEKASFNPPKVAGYWENKENVLQFLSEMKEKYNLNTFEDWNSITTYHIQSNGGGRLLRKYSMFELKCLACPEGKSTFNTPSRYWEKIENIHNFLAEIKAKYKLNTPEDWNSITRNHITSNGGLLLSTKYSMFELKCMACPEGKSIFNNPQRHAPGFWENDENVHSFISEIKEKYNLKTPEDWKRISRYQIISEGGSGLFISPNYSQIKIKFETPNQRNEFVPLSKLISRSAHKRSSQRWLFLQVQKLFPQEEIVEDYFHSDLSRISGANVQFDIFMIERNIAIEYHGRHHYEDIPSGFANVETYKQRDEEKEKLCSEHGIQLIVIPYWWDNKIESLKETLYSKIEQK